MFAVQAEGETEKIGLVRPVVEARFGKIGERVRSDIENGDRLVGVFAVSRVGPISAVEENDKPPIGRSGSSRSEIVDRARMAGNFAEQAAIRKLGWRLRDGSPQKNKLA